MRILLLTLLLVTAAVVPTTMASLPAPKQEKIIGTVVAYDHLNNLMFLTDVESRVVLIVRIDPRKGDKTRFIQVAYNYYQGKFTKNGFPDVLVDRTRQWRFKLVRDSSCDRPVQEFAPMEDAKTGKTIDKGAPIWKLIPGAEDEKIPFGETLPCYSLKAGGYKLHLK